MMIYSTKAMGETITQEVAKIPVEDFKALIEAAPQALQLNTSLLTKASAKSDELRALVASRPMDDDLDEQLKEYIINLGGAKDKCLGRRSPFTRILGQVVKAFTSIENWFDSEKEFCQKVRDGYAADLIRAQREREQKAQLELLKSKEKVEVKSKLEADFDMHLVNQITKQRDTMFLQFDKITLENFDKAAAYFNGLKFSYSETDFNAWTCFIGSKMLSQDEIIELQRQVKEGKYEGFKENYINQLSISLQDIIDKLPGKKKELDEITKAKGKEAERLKAEAESRAKVESDNRAKAEAEAKEKAEAEAATKKDVALAETLFDHEANLAAVSPEAPKGREGYEITVNAVPGFMLIFNQWYQIEGKTLTVDQFSKKKVDSMVTFCEKHAQKTGEKIDSPLITYTEIFKTSNRA